MIKTTPKKVMEIIFIFIIPLIVLIFGFSFYTTKGEVIEEGYTSTDTNFYIEYEFRIIEDDSPIYKIIDIPFNLLGFNSSQAKYIIVDYTALWFTQFIIWHLLYLFFDTIMHKVLLRKE